MRQEIQLQRTPRFNIGDKVVIVSPTIDQGKQGMVIRIIDHFGDYVYRYDVQFADGTLKRYFGFEIDSALPRSA